MPGTQEKDEIELLSDSIPLPTCGTRCYRLLMPIDLTPWATQYRDRMPQHVEDSLHESGVHRVVAHTRLLGWNGKHVTVPVFRDDNTVSGFEYWKNAGDGFEVVGNAIPEPPQLYNAETLRERRHAIVITEGIHECLTLWSNFFAAVAATGNGRSFKPAWVRRFTHLRRVYVCFKRGKDSEAAAFNIAAQIPQARLVELPGAVSGGGISDYFKLPETGPLTFKKILDAADSVSAREDAA